jgi:hypothetical protein
MKPQGKPIKWSHEIAYIVGLMTTDGCLSSDGRHLEITSNDIQLLKTFRKCLKIKNRIRRKLSGFTGKRSSYHIQFGNVIFYRWLLNIGLMPRKTGRLGSLKIPNKYFFHFLRGHLDGDGSFLRYQDPIFPKSERIYIKFRSKNLEHLMWLQSRINSLLKIKGHIAKDGNVFSLRFAKRASLILLPYLYPTKYVPCLKRKYNIVKDLITYR